MGGLRDSSEVVVPGEIFWVNNYFYFGFAKRKLSAKDNALSLHLMFISLAMLKALAKIGFEVKGKKGSHIKLKKKFNGKIFIVIVQIILNWQSEH